MRGATPWMLLTGFERRAEELIAKDFGHIVPDDLWATSEERSAYWRLVCELAAELEAAETDRALEVFARWRAQ